MKLLQKVSSGLKEQMRGANITANTNHETSIRHA